MFVALLCAPPRLRPPSRPLQEWRAVLVRVVLTSQKSVERVFLRPVRYKRRSVVGSDGFNNIGFHV